MTSVVQTAMTKTLEGMQPKQVFGEPIERDGVTYLPVAKVRGGGGRRRRQRGQRWRRLRADGDAGRHL